VRTGCLCNNKPAGDCIYQLRRRIPRPDVRRIHRSWVRDSIRSATYHDPRENHQHHRRSPTSRRKARDRHRVGRSDQRLGFSDGTVRPVPSQNLSLRVLSSKSRIAAICSSAAQTWANPLRHFGSLNQDPIAGQLHLSRITSLATPAPPPRFRARKQKTRSIFLRPEGIFQSQPTLLRVA
jgi:hypothetical protein